MAGGRAWNASRERDEPITDHRTTRSMSTMYHPLRRSRGNSREVWMNTQPAEEDYRTCQGHARGGRDVRSALVSAAFILIGGKIGDLIGRKRAYVLWLVCYAVGAVAMILAQSLLRSSSSGR